MERQRERMGKVAAALFSQCSHPLSGSSKERYAAIIPPSLKWKKRELAKQIQIAKAKPSGEEAAQPLHSNLSHNHGSTDTFSASISTDVPLYEPPGISFDDYIIDRPRVFGAMFPDKARSQRLNDEEWRIQMLPIRFLFGSVSPVVVMRLRCKSQGTDYPAAVPLHVSRVLELQATRWELRGLDGISMPSHFDLSVQGALYPVRRGGRNRLKGYLQISISLALPPVLALVPKDVLKAVTESVLRRLVEKMMQEVDAGLLSDFRHFGREKLSKHGQGSLPPATTTRSTLGGNQETN